LRNPEASEAIHAGIAQSVSSTKELQIALENNLNPTVNTIERSKRFIDQHVGCSDLICADLKKRFC
jgi:hypothetical protein